MNNTKSVQETETHKILWDFEIQTDNLILAKQPDLVLVNKKKKSHRIMNFAVSVDHWVKLKKKKKTKREIST